MQAHLPGGILTHSGRLNLHWYTHYVKNYIQRHPCRGTDRNYVTPQRLPSYAACKKWSL